VSTIGTTLKLLLDAYPRQDVGADTLQVYRGILADIDAQDLWDAAQRHIATSRWFPTIAELREAVTANRKAIGQGWPEADEAWQWVLTSMHENPAPYNPACYQPPGLGDDPRFGPACRAVSAIGGTGVIDHTGPEWMGALQARFRSMYEDILDRETAWDRLPGSVREQLPAPRQGKPMRAIDPVQALRAIAGVGSSASESPQDERPGPKDG